MKKLTVLLCVFGQLFAGENSIIKQPGAERESDVFYHAKDISGRLCKGTLTADDKFDIACCTECACCLLGSGACGSACCAWGAGYNGTNCAVTGCMSFACLLPIVYAGSKWVDKDKK